MAIDAVRGRYWYCDWLCLRGSFFDLLLSRISLKRRIPVLFRDTQSRLLVMMAMMTILVSQLPETWPHMGGIGKVFVMMVTVTKVMAIVLGVLTHPRNWCAYCPAGTMANWPGMGKHPLTMSCGCNLRRKCDPVCPMQIKRWQYRPERMERAAVAQWDCLKCGLCLEASPQKALAFKVDA